MNVANVRGQTRTGVMGLAIGVLAIILAIVLTAAVDKQTSTWLIIEQALVFFGAVLSALAVHQLVD